MAIRLFSASSPLRGLFKTRPKINVNRNGSLRNGSMFPEPPVPWLESPSVLFSAEALKHNYGAIPMIVICLCGFTIDCILIARLALTRDDVYYTQNSAACDFIETRRGYKVPVRKLLVINQKYENPPGLLESIQGDVDGPPCEDDKKAGKKKAKK